MEKRFTECSELFSLDPFLSYSWQI